MVKFREIKVKYVPTKVVLTIPEPDLVKILKNDRGNFEVLDKNFNLPREKEVVETTTFEQVVEEDKVTEDNQKQPTREEELNAHKVVELIAYCDDKKITYTKNDKKADLIAKIIEAEKNATSIENTVTEEVTEDKE